MAQYKRIDIVDAVYYDGTPESAQALGLVSYDPTTGWALWQWSGPDGPEEMDALPGYWLITPDPTIDVSRSSLIDVEFKKLHAPV